MSTLSLNCVRRREVRRTAVVVAIVGLLLAACGGGGSSASSASPSSATSSDQRTAEQRAADQKTAEAVIFKLSDFPPGWESQPQDSSSTPSELKTAATKFGQCLHVDPALVTNVSDSSKTKADSDTFTDSHDLQVDSKATVEPSPEAAMQGLTAFQQPDARGCLKDFFDATLSYVLAHPKSGQQLPKGVTIGNIEVGQVNLPGIHGEAVAYRLTIPVTAGISIKLFIDFVLAVNGRTGMTLTYQNIGDPFPQDMEVQLSNTVIDRAPAS
jgi:hypothetical protein